MTDHSHLDNLVAATPEGLNRKLLEAFRQMLRGSAEGAMDYSSRLKTLMEENLQDSDADPAP